MSRKSCSIVIPTYNRCDDLRHTCQQLRKLDPPPDEVIICLDGCTDRSREMLQREFPDFRVIENATQQGSIPSRDRAFRQVQSDLIITLDDDSYPMDSAFIDKVSDLVEQHPEAGAFTFPEIWNDGSSPDPNLTPQSPGHYVREFPNCAGVMLRAHYGKQAEYSPFFSHTYAEPDYCLQLYAAGYAVWFEPSLLIRHHFVGKERNMLNRHALNARNELWSVLMRCPMPQILIIAPLRVARQFLFAVSKGRAWWCREPIWWWSAAKGFPQCFRNRRPVRWQSYAAWMWLARRPTSSRQVLATRFGWQPRLAKPRAAPNPVLAESLHD